MLRVVESRARKPLRTRHCPLGQYATVRCGGLHAKIFPQRLPEIFDVGNRPSPQRFVIAERQPALTIQPRTEFRDITGSYLSGSRKPQQFAFANWSFLRGREGPGVAHGAQMWFAFISRAINSA